ncbi:MAG TPA: ATP-binding protein [Polyangia bacterium]|nr:ATP-binding protein [Polyangia bacterium]
MAVDDSVIAALEAAVGAAPDNRALRLHLGGLLLEAGRDKAALDHCAVVLAAAPDDLAALDLGARAATAAGDVARAEGYRRIWTALSGVAAAPPAVSPAPAPPSDPTLAPVVPLRVIEGGAGGIADVEISQVKLADVAGMEEVKRRLQLSFLAPLRNPEMMRAYGKSLRGGLLLYGPPGCGKTFIARAVAGELGASFITVGLSDVLDMWLGQSERNLHELFETARRAAPCVLFFDEIDALGRKRTLQRHSAGANVVNQLLAELDGVGSDNAGVFVLAATNHPWDVDAALRRPGRFDRTVLVLPPDLAAREAILRMALRDRPVAGGIDLGRFAKRTEDFSGADLTHLAQSAAELAMEEGLASGAVRPIDGGHLERALRELRPSTHVWIETARNYVMFANEGGVYDDLQAYLRARKKL